VFAVAVSTAVGVGESIEAIEVFVAAAGHEVSAMVEVTVSDVAPKIPVTV
jgi:hypothetical protein